ncbi:MAG: hypothetical protein WCL34_14160 [Methylococcaceae bacterium]
MNIYLVLLVLNVVLAVTALLILDVIALNTCKYQSVRHTKLRDKLHFAMTQSRGAT